MVVCTKIEGGDRAKETLYGEGWEKMDKMGERMVGGQPTQTREKYCGGQEKVGINWVGL